MKEFNSNPDKTILTIVVGLIVIFVFTKVNGFLYAALLIGLVGLVSIYLAKRIEWVWMKLAYLLSFVVPNVLLTLIYYILLTPLALLSRIGKKNPLQLKNTKESMFKVRESEIQPSNFEKTW